MVEVTEQARQQFARVCIESARACFVALYKSTSMEMNAAGAKSVLRKSGTVCSINPNLS
jgi:hypothetical protein